MIEIFSGVLAAFLIVGFLFLLGFVTDFIEKHKEILSGISICVFCALVFSALVVIVSRLLNPIIMSMFQ